MEKVVWDLKSQFEKYKNVNMFDSMIAEFLLSEGRFVHSQDTVLKKYGVESLEELGKLQKKKLGELAKLNSLFTDIEMPLIPVLRHMETAGILLDVQCMKEVGEEIRKA